MEIPHPLETCPLVSLYGFLLSPVVDERYQQQDPVMRPTLVYHES